MLCSDKFAPDAIINNCFVALAVLEPAGAYALTATVAVPFAAIPDNVKVGGEEAHEVNAEETP